MVQHHQPLKAILSLNHNKRILWELILLAVLCFFPLCYQINHQAIRQWDESRNAVNALEMLQNHNYIVRYFDGLPENWETKPPLLIWLQVLCFKVFGINELAIRFPVIMATLLTVAALILYCYKYCKNRYMGYLATLVLVTSPGYIDRHIARTGDHDALLIFFLLTVILLFYRYLLSEKPKWYLLPCISLLMALAVLTKSIAALFILPGMVISSFLFKAWGKLFTDKSFYLSWAIFMLIVAGYYIAREIKQPGYLSIVWHEELFLRYANTENRFESGTFWYYLVHFVQSRFVPWIFLLVPACILLPFISLKPEKRFFRYLLIHSLVFFVLISAGSKNQWYDGLLYPLFSIIIALFIVNGIRFLHTRFPALFLKKLLPIPVMLIFLCPYIAIIKKVSRNVEYSWDQELYAMPYLLRDPSILSRLPQPLHVLYEGYSAHLMFYTEAENFKKGKQLLLLTQPSSLLAGNAVIYSQKAVGDSIQKHFKLDTIMTDGMVVVGRVRPAVGDNW